MSTEQKPKTIERRVLDLEYFEEKTERHLSELKEDVKTMSDDVTDIKNAIIGNSLNGETGLVKMVVDIKKKQDLDDEILNTHKIYFKQIAWFVGVVVAVLIGVVVKLLGK